MQTCDTTRDHHHTSPVIFSCGSIAHFSVGGGGEQIEENDGEEVMGYGVDLEGGGPVGVGGGPEGGLEFG
jgi:hypothetical protein